MKNSQRGFVPLVIIVIAVVILGAGTYFVINKSSGLKESEKVSVVAISDSTASSTDQTADWETYTNTTYGFEIMHPSLYEVDTWEDNGSHKIGFKEPDGQDHDFVIEVKTVLKEEVESTLPVLSIKSRKITSRENVTINGLSWTKIIVDDFSRVHYIYKDGKRYATQYSVLSNPTARDRELVAMHVLMATSFKFKK